MRAAVLTICLFVSSMASADTCETLLSGRVVLNDDLDRVAITQLARQPDLLLVGAEALTSLQAVRVLTLRGVDLLLVVDAETLRREGVRAFLQRHLEVDISSPILAPWISAITERFKNYDQEADVSKSLASIWGAPELFKTIDDIFFLRFFSPGLERQAAKTGGLVKAPVGSERIALISLRVPGATTEDAATPSTGQDGPLKSSSLFVPLASTPSRVAKRANISTPKPQTDSRKPPLNTMYQIPSLDKNPTYVSWDYSGTTQKTYGRMLEKYLTQDIPKILFRPRPDLIATVVGYPDVPKLVVMRKIKTEFYTQISVVALMPISTGEVAQMQFEDNRNYLESASEIDIEIKGLPLIHSGIYLPNAVVDNSMAVLNSYSFGLKRLYVHMREEFDDLQNLAVGEMRMLTNNPRLRDRKTLSEPEVGEDISDVNTPDSSVRMGRTFVFLRGSDTKIYLLSMLTNEESLVP